MNNNADPKLTDTDKILIQKYLGSIFKYLGIVNLAALFAGAIYILEVLPDKAFEEVSKKIHKN